MRALALRVQKLWANEVLQRLKQEELLRLDLEPIRKKDYVLFPIREKREWMKEFGEIILENFPERNYRPRNIREALWGRIPESLLEKIPRAFDIVGDIAILELPDELRPYFRIIGEAVARVHKNVKVVCRRAGIHEGEFRVRPVEVIWGERRTETIHKEHGCLFKLDVARVYFSPRLGEERKRIAKLVKPGEVVGALFAGVGPYPIVIARIQPKVKKIYAVEINPVAFEYMVENIRLNKVEKKIVPYLGDVREVVPEKFPHECDRVLMPLPFGAESFLDVAFEALKKEGGVIHYYRAARDPNVFEGPIEELKSAAEERGAQLKILAKRRVGQVAPRLWRVVIDAEIRF